MTTKSTTLGTSLKALLRENLEWIESEQARLLRDAGFDAATRAEIRLIAAMKGQNRKIADLARKLDISRQAAHQTVHKLIARGIVRLEDVPENKREKLVVITAFGHETLALTAQHFQIIERQVAANIGADNYHLLKQLLTNNARRFREET